MKPRLRIVGDMWTAKLPCGRIVECGLVCVTRVEIAIREVLREEAKCLIALRRSSANVSAR
jgi:hypothetical protein